VFLLNETLIVIFANGDLPNPKRLLPTLAAAKWIIAADGGLHHLEKLGIPPHLLIGDLDSVTTEQVAWAQTHGCQIDRYPPAKNETDLELALLAAVKHGAGQILVAAALGGRLDQTLGNLSLLRLPELREVDVRFDDGHEEVLLIREQVTLHGTSGETVSLLPLWGEVNGVTTRALLYPLHAETLYPERTRGISNVMTSNEAGVSITHGELLCIHTYSSNHLQEESNEK
jgi:thiamine pyrophosphokinase